MKRSSLKIVFLFIMVMLLSFSTVIAAPQSVLETDGGGGGIITKHEANKDVWKSNGTQHYHPCVCGKCSLTWSDGAHEGGTATCEKAKVCDICKLSYGNTVSHSANSNTKFQNIAGTNEHAKACRWCGQLVVNKAECSGSYTGDKDNHWKVCDTCANEYDKEEHTEIVVAKKDDENHAIKCSVEGCPYDEDGDEIKEEKHSYDDTYGDEHICTKCEEKNETQPHHGFSEGKCKLEECTAELSFTVDGGASLNALPFRNEYYMIGYGGDESWEKSLDEIIFEVNLTPYRNTDSDFIMDYFSIEMTKFEHGNWDMHNSQFSGTIITENKIPTFIYAPIENYYAGIESVYETFIELYELPRTYIRKQYGQWGTDAWGEYFDSEEVFLMAEYKDKQYKFTDIPKSGHWRINWLECDFLPNVLDSHKNRIFYNGGGHPAPTNIYAFLTTGYRDVEGNKISDKSNSKGYISDVVSSGVTWINGNTGHSFSFKVDLDKVEKLGYRYKGYKVGSGTGIPTNLDCSQGYNTATSGSVSTSIDDMFKYVTFIFEPIQVKVTHKVRNGNTEGIINTTKNETYSLPKLLETEIYKNHKCTEQCTGEAGEVITHANTSFNKYLWPGYILTNYELRTSKGKVIEEKTYDLINDEPITDATTRVASSEDNAKYGIEIPRELYQKTVNIATDINTGEKKGYRSDIELDFIYSNVDVRVNHKEYETSKLIKGKSGKDLTYLKTLNGHYFILSSLITQDENLLTELDEVYDITGRIIKKITITKKGKIVWEKELELEQSEEFKNEAVNATNLLYYIISSNDLDAGLLSEINRIGSDIEFDFYYQKVPMLTIKHHDEQGNKLWPDEYIPLLNDPTPAKSKDLKQWSYVYKENTLDGTPMPVTQPDPTSDVRNVNVPLNGTNDRTLIYIYNQDIPVLTVKYVDESGSEIANKTEYKMEKETVTTSAKDLSGISYEYKYYNLYEGADTTTNKEETENAAVSATVKKNGNNRLLIFVYTKKEISSNIDSSQIKSESVILKSNDRDGTEEYNVLKAIPTSEDLYANVITDSFLLSRVVSQAEKKATVYVKLIQPYYDSSNTDSGQAGDIAITDDETFVITSDDYVQIEMPYSYFTAKNVQLNIISKAIVKNGSIEVRENGNIKEVDQVTLYPDYGGVEPSLNYEVGGELVFKDLAKNYSSMSGKSVEEYVDGLAAGKYNLTTGFYNVEKKDTGEIYVEYVLPDIEYTEVTAKDMKAIVKRYLDNPALLTRAAEDNGVTVKMDKLSVTREDGSEVVILSGAALPINREYTLLQLESQKLINLNPDAPLISNNVLYKKDGIYVTKTEENKEYSTTADVYYKPRQRVNPTTLKVETIADNTTFIESENYKDYKVTPNGEILVKAKENIPGNSVWVHTPVVNNTKIKENKNGDANNQWTEASRTKNNSSNMTTLVLGQPFTIEIPHSGAHINEIGYKTNHYNYDGIHYQGNIKANEQNGLENNHESFAKARDIKFTFGVIYHKTVAGGEKSTYYPANTWINLGVGSNTTFKFTVPEWEEERWKAGNQHTIETRVVAENCSNEKLTRTENSANKDRNNYVAVKTINVKVIGEMFDLEIRGTNDPGWTQLVSSLPTSEFPIGQPGQNRNPAYKYGLKLGTSVYFDIATTGWIGDTTESIKLEPDYYFASKADGKVTKVDLYYKQSPTTPYKQLETNPIKISTIMSQDNYKGVNYVSRYAKLIANSKGLFAMDAARELSNTTKLLSKYSRPAINYSVAIQLMENNYIRLPYATRLAYQRAIELLPTKYSNIEAFPSTVAGTDYCIGHWYGAMRLPSTTIAVPEGNPTPKLPTEGLKDGYIIVTLDDVLSYDENEEYLTYDPLRYNQEGGPDDKIKLPNGKDTTIPKGPDGEPERPFAIYELIADKVDYEMGGTH